MFSGFDSQLIATGETSIFIRRGGAGPPLLLLHGTADSPADGGSELTDVQRARTFEAAARGAGMPVEAVYYEGGGHNGLFASPTQYEDEVRRMAEFLRVHLHG